MRSRNTIEDFIFIVTHPVTFGFTSDEKELLAENISINAEMYIGRTLDTADILHVINDGSRDIDYYKVVGKIAQAWEHAGFVKEMQDILDTIAKYHRLKRNFAGLKVYKEKKDRNEYGRR